MIKYAHRKAVTLVEMLVVVGIVVMLAAVVMEVGGRLHEQAQRQLTRTTISTLQGALEKYHSYTGFFPEANGVDPNVNCEILYSELHAIPDSRKVLAEVNDSLIGLRGGNPNQPEIYDPWNNVIYYYYVQNERTFPELRSAGPDGLYETADDITNLE